MRFESLLVLILFKFKKRPNISRIRVVIIKNINIIINISFQGIKKVIIIL